MDPRVLALVILVLGAPLAGCIGGGEAPVSPAAEVEAPPFDLPLRADVDVAAWAVGDAWDVVTTGEGAGTRSTLVVTAADAEGYTLSTTDEGTAGYDALEDVSYLGRIRASDLAGSQQGAPVQFFSFPLTDGKTWTTTWDGLAVTLTATFVPAMDTTAGIHPGFAIEGKADGESYVKYDYVPMLKWWSKLAFANGYGFRVERVHVNWTGEVLRAEAATLLEATTSAPGAPGAHAFTVGEGQSFVALSYAGEAQAYARGYVLVAPDGMPHATGPSGVTAGKGASGFEERLPPTPGEWRLLVPTLHADGAFRIVVRQVALVPFAFP